METSSFHEFIQIIALGDLNQVKVRLRQTPALATMVLPSGVKERKTTETFITEIRRSVYGGDTALHIAASAFYKPIAELLVSCGADCRATNRRGAEPLHYAADGRGSRSHSQAEVIKYLVSIGADPDAIDKSGVAPLHRAVRTRSHAAVLALLDAGANPRLRNKAGSTPLHLAVQSTGASGSGTDEAHQQQELIINLLLDRGAKLTDEDFSGKTVRKAATGYGIQSVLASKADR
ncbi:MAG: ankyrin repeat domain-containing protein [Planctomycetaceae bacterium]